MTPLLINLVPDLGDIAWLFIGILGVQVWQWIKCKWKDHWYPEERPHVMKKLNWFYVWTAITLAVIVAVGIQNLKTQTFAANLAQDTARCQAQFNNALRSNRVINAEDRSLRKEFEDATLARVRALTNLPPDLRGDPVTDPGYVVYKAQIDQAYFAAISSINDRDEENDERRQLPENQYPEPTCGK